MALTVFPRSQDSPVQAHYSILAYRSCLRFTDIQYNAVILYLSYLVQEHSSLRSGHFLVSWGLPVFFVSLIPCSSEPATLKPEKPLIGESGWWIPLRFVLAVNRSPLSKRRLLSWVLRKTRPSNSR